MHQQFTSQYVLIPRDYQYFQNSKKLNCNLPINYASKVIPITVFFIRSLMKMSGIIHIDFLQILES